MLGLGKLLVTAGCRLRKKWTAVVPTQERVQAVMGEKLAQQEELEEGEKITTPGNKIPFSQIRTREGTSERPREGLKEWCSVLTASESF